MGGVEGNFPTIIVTEVGRVLALLIVGLLLLHNQTLQKNSKKTLKTFITQI
jgi:hypothetical protein